MGIDSREGSLLRLEFSLKFCPQHAHEREWEGGGDSLVPSLLWSVYFLHPFRKGHSSVDTYTQMSDHVWQNMAATLYIEMLVHNYCIRLRTALNLCISYKYTYFKEVHTEVSVYYT